MFYLSMVWTNGKYSAELHLNSLQKILSNMKEPSHRIIKYLAIQLSNQVLKYFGEQNDPNSI